MDVVRMCTLISSLKRLSVLALFSSFILLQACGGGGGGGGAAATTTPAATNPSAYPEEADSNEGSAGNDTPDTATTVTVGDEVQVRTIYPQADKDVYAIQLTAGVTYEFSSNNLCATCDTYLYLVDIDKTSAITDDDDYLDYDSRISYTPTVSGVYYLRVEGYDVEYGIASYTFGARVFVDDDSDSYSTYYDCNDADDTIYPFATEIAGDGIDQNCSGHDIPVATNADEHETDDTPETAVEMLEMQGADDEIIYRDALYAASGNLRTIDGVGAVDYMSITVPAMSAIYDYAGPASGQLYNDTSISAEIFEADGVTPVTLTNFSGDDELFNPTNSPLTFYYKFAASDGTSTGVYVPSYYSIGQDLDGDGFYTKNWDSARDCDDNNADINGNATETLGDGIDSNCNGADDT